MQSIHGSKPKPLPLPWGMGTMAWRGRVWWLQYRDAGGEVHYENSGTDDAVEVQRMLARKAMPRAKALVAALTAIIDGTPFQTKGKSQAGARDRAGLGQGRGPVRHDAAVGGDRRATRKGGKR